MNAASVDSVQQEVAEEKAGALGRAGLQLQYALGLLREHESSRTGDIGAAAARRERLLWDLSERVQAFVVHREACGLRDFRYVLDFYGVPHEAIARVGAKRPSESD